jgi:hypothetical protein
MSKKALVPINVLSSATEPVGEYVGDVYFNNSTMSLYLYNGVHWVELVPAPITEDGGLPNSSYTGTGMDGGAPDTTTFDSNFNGGTA